MSIRTPAVRVHQVPCNVKGSTERKFLQELQKFAETARPRLVLDCSEVTYMDPATIRLLLSSLEEVMKSNGDVRLASLPPQAEAALRAAGVNRLFEIYATAEGAVNSFHQRTASIAPQSSEAESFDRDSEHAA